MNSARGTSNRRRGHRAEVSVVSYLRGVGFPDAVTTRNTGGAGGRQVGDVSFAPGVCLEVKDVAAHAWPAWLRQAVEEAGPKRVPVVVRRLRGTPDVASWPCVVPRKWWDRNMRLWAFPVAAVTKMRGDYGKYLTMRGDDPEFGAVVDGEWVVTRFWRVAEAFRLDR